MTSVDAHQSLSSFKNFYSNTVQGGEKPLRGLNPPAIMSPRQLFKEEGEQQPTLLDFRYDPLTVGEASKSSYREVPAPARERCLKNNPFIPAVSYVPVGQVVADQPALNIANTTEPGLPTLQDAAEEKVYPDGEPYFYGCDPRPQRMVARNIKHFLDSRQQERRLQARIFRTDNPDAPTVADVKRHRAKAMGEIATKKASKDLAQQLADVLLTDEQKLRRQFGLPEKSSIPGISAGARASLAEAAEP